MIALIGAALAVFWQAPGRARGETFESQCRSRLRVATSPPGRLLLPSNGEVTVEFSFPPSESSQTVVVTLVAVSTGTDCSEVEVRTRTQRVSGGGTSPEVPGENFNLPDGSASFGGYNSYGEFDFRRTRVSAKRPSGEEFLLRTSNGEALVGGPDQAFEVVSSEGTSCHNGRFYYGIRANGNTWTSGCVTTEQAAKLGWDEENSSVSSPDQDEGPTLTSGLSGWSMSKGD